MKKLTTISLFLLLGLAVPHFVRAQALPMDEKQKIEALIKQVATLQDARFFRNGVSYSANTAVTFLQLKWQADTANVKTASDFIDKIASISGIGKPYMIRFKDGRDMLGRDYLLAELKKLDT
jgi:lipopolysaccharide export system protein LptA